MNTLHWIKHSIATLSTLTVIACGGGGSDGGESSTDLTTVPVQTTTSYPPSSEKLLSNANSSSELYVEENFKFNHDKHTQIQIQAKDENSQGIPYARLNIYVLDNGIVASDQMVWADDLAEHARLVTAGQTNAQGLFTRIIEFAGISNEAPILMIELNALGIENKILVSVTSERTLITLGS